ncbi:MAG: alpha/beta hydrolase [Clostridia bacterium]|jgi:epsilon-lactone hydrolase|nr:alpha/beta hydrolase [Clostridia bacterium]MBT7122996.1 alpha/beta hydrolase [Clostridia bacterium]
MISRKARFFEKALGSIKLKSIVYKMMLKPKRRNKFTLPPKSLYKKYDVDSFDIDGSKCVTVKPSDSPPWHIVFFHGGGYCMQATIAHWHLVDAVIARTGAAVTFVNYPLAPQSTCTDTINMVSQAYTHLFKTTEQEIILMGDSAGGGLALALAQYIKAEKIAPSPSKIVLLSPWLDVSMDGDISDSLANSDKLLEKRTLVEAGRMYAGDLNKKDYRCSPLYGDIADIGQIALFAGGGEILSVQASAFKRKAAQENVSLLYREYPDMQHDWLLFPLPEAKQALGEVCAFISNGTELTTDS